MGHHQPQSCATGCCNEPPPGCHYPIGLPAAKTGNWAINNNYYCIHNDQTEGLVLYSAPNSADSMRLSMSVEWSGADEAIPQLSISGTDWTIDVEKLVQEVDNYWTLLFAYTDEDNHWFVKFFDPCGVTYKSNGSIRSRYSAVQYEIGKVVAGTTTNTSTGTMPYYPTTIGAMNWKRFGFFLCLSRGLDDEYYIQLVNDVGHTLTDMSSQGGQIIVHDKDAGTTETRDANDLLWDAVRHPQIALTGLDLSGTRVGWRTSTEGTAIARNVEEVYGPFLDNGGRYGNDEPPNECLTRGYSHLLMQKRFWPKVWRVKAHYAEIPYLRPAFVWEQDVVMTANDTFGLTPFTNVFDERMPIRLKCTLGNSYAAQAFGQWIGGGPLENEDPEITIWYTDGHSASAVIDSSVAFDPWDYHEDNPLSLTVESPSIHDAIYIWPLPDYGVIPKLW